MRFPSASGRASPRAVAQWEVFLGHAATAGDRRCATRSPAYVTSARGARCVPEQIFIVNGAQQALDLAARVLIEPGDAAWMEDPGYAGARVALAGAGARVIPVPVDEEGLDVAAGARLARDARSRTSRRRINFPSARS